MLLFVKLFETKRWSQHEKDELFFANLTTLAGKWVGLGVDLHHQNHTTAVGKPTDKALGFKLQAGIAKNIPTFEQWVSDGCYDFIYMNPYHYVYVLTEAWITSFRTRKRQTHSGDSSGTKGFSD